MDETIWCQREIWKNHKRISWRAFFFFFLPDKKTHVGKQTCQPWRSDSDRYYHPDFFCHSGVLMCISITFSLFHFFLVVWVLFFHPYFNNTLRVSKFQSLIAQQRKTGLTLVSTHICIARKKITGGVLLFISRGKCISKRSEGLI